jgi:peptidoglycan/LPS O-acetylase OafA/YrhL
MHNAVNVRYRADIDGLRAVAVVGVLLFHFGLGCPGGFVGVDVFFVISGFLITQIILDDLENTRWSLPNFWERRLRRIWPACIAMTAVVLGAGWFVMLPADYRALANDAMAQLLMAGNFRYWLGTDYFAEAADLRPLLHTWSLAVEEQFYILWPVVLPLMWRMGRRWCISVVSIFVVVSFGANALLTPLMPAATFFLLPFRAWQLALGAVIAMAPYLKPQSVTQSNAALATGLTLIGMSYATFNRTTPYPGWYALAPTAGAALAVIAGRGPQSSLVQLLGAAPIRSVGLMSYSLYLVHWPVAAMYRYVYGPFDVAQALFLFGASVVLAALSYTTIELPFRRRQHSGGLRATVVRTVTASAIIAVLAGMIRLLDGVPSRVRPDIATYCQATKARDFRCVQEFVDRPIGYFGASRDNGAQPCVFFWGDSHGMALMPVIDELARDVGVRGLYELRPGTLPLPPCAVPSPQGVLTGIKQDDARGARILDWIAKSRPRHVIICARWTVYVTGADSDGQYLLAPAEESLNSMEDNRVRAFEIRLDRLARCCEVAGASLWMFLEVPYQAKKPHRRAIEAMHFDRPIDLAGVLRDVHDAKVRIISTVAARTCTPHRVVDLGALVFRDDEYSHVGNGVTRWYDDNTHVSPEGSRHFFTDALSGILEEIAADCGAQTRDRAGASNAHF